MPADQDQPSSTDENTENFPFYMLEDLNEEAWPEKIVNLPIKEFNDFVKTHNLSREHVLRLKKQRRRLKGRSYAQEARKRRAAKQKTITQQLEETERRNQQLEAQMKLLQQRVAQLEQQAAIHGYSAGPSA